MTLQVMRQVVVDAITSYQNVRQRAVELQRGIHATGPLDLIDGVRNYVRQHVTLFDEYDELIRHPDTMLREIDARGYTTGDCDDQAVLTAALLASVGIQVRFKAVLPDCPGGPMTHVFVEYKYGGEWLPLDTSSDYAPIYGTDYLVEAI